MNALQGGVSVIDRNLIVTWSVCIDPTRVVWNQPWDMTSKIDLASHHVLFSPWIVASSSSLFLFRTSNRCEPMGSVHLDLENGDMHGYADMLSSKTRNPNLERRLNSPELGARRRTSEKSTRAGAKITSLARIVRWWECTLQENGHPFRDIQL